MLTVTTIKRNFIPGTVVEGSVEPLKLKDGSIGRKLRITSMGRTRVAVVLPAKVEAFEAIDASTFASFEISPDGIPVFFHQKITA